MPATVSIFDTDYDPRIADAARVLGDGGLVVLPSETVYGVAGLLNRPAAVTRLKALRGGSDAKAFTINVASREKAADFLGPISDLGARMMRKLWPGPVGLQFEVDAPRRAEVSSRLGLDAALLYEDGIITLRCPDNIVAQDVISQVDGPVALTAPHGAALSVDALSDDLVGKVDLILDAGATRYAKPSTLVRVFGDRYEIVRVGVYDDRIIERLLHTTILFVCSGNTCRSPMAEALARQLLARKLAIEEQDLERRGVSVMSAGALAAPGARATPEAVQAVRSLGADLSRHRSRPLTVEIIHQADVIFTMGRGHARAVMSMVPSSGDKVQTLDPDGDIEDPIGGDVSLYKDLAAQLQVLIERRLEEHGELLAR